jgi:hypothetical protein
VIFWLNHGVKHSSPFVKVGARCMSYNFYFWIFSSFVQTFWVCLGQTCLDRAVLGTGALGHVLSRVHQVSAPVSVPRSSHPVGPTVTPLAPLPPRQQNRQTAPSFPLLSPLSSANGVDTCRPSLSPAPRVVHAEREREKERERERERERGKRRRRLSCHCHCHRLTSHHLPH